MSDDTRMDEFHFAWEGAAHPNGPWHHLRVLEFRGRETISRPFELELELFHDNRGADVDVEELVGARAALKLFTRTEPTHRIVHALITSATQLELSDSSDISRYRVRLAPPIVRSSMMRRSRIFLEKTLREIVEQVLQSAVLGPAMTPSSSPRPLDASPQLDSYTPPSVSFAWAIEDTRRLDDVTARPFCVQFDESDYDFVSRLLEEEGIAYHFEHAEDECVLVLTDYDGGRIDRTSEAHFGPRIAGREVFDWRAGGHLRPRSVHIDDYNWQKPNLDLSAASPSGVTDFTDVAYPGRYQESAGHGAALADKREQRFDTERVSAVASGHCRLLAAGTVLVVDHPVDKFSGTYLVTQVVHRGVQRHFAADGREADEPYRQELEMIRCGKGGQVAPSNYRPARLTPKPRIFATQTAVVTADPSDPEAEIHVGGPADIGCVRVRFRWDRDDDRLAREPSSCWVRVSQFFAGTDHGALWHPRVGDEVIVEYLDGDPDRPIITGRVYNGTNPAPENATNRPTYSAIKSNTSPYNGNFNLIAFEDLQGSEEIIIHAARDWNSNVERNCTRGVGVNETIHVKGDQKITVDGSQTVNIGVNQSIHVGAKIYCEAGTSISNVSILIENDASAVFRASAGSFLQANAGAVAILRAPLTRVDATLLFLVGDALVKVNGSVVEIVGGSKITESAPTIHIVAKGDLVLQGGASVKVVGGTVDVSGSTVNINGKGGTKIIGAGGTIDVKGDIHLN